MLSFRSLSRLALSSLPVACGGPSALEIAEQEIVLSVAGTTSAPDAAAIGESEGGLGVERAVVRATAVTLSACRADTADLTLGARAYDLLSQPPASELVLTAATELCRIRVEIDASKRNQLENVPDAASLYVSGVTHQGERVEWSSPRSFSLVFDAGEEHSFGADPLLLGFDLAAWLASLPVPDGLEDEELERFEAQLRDAAALYVDRDGDGALGETSSRLSRDRAATDRAGSFRRAGGPRRCHPAFPGCRARARPSPLRPSTRRRAGRKSRERGCAPCSRSG